jgi:hypothetical protein
MTKTDTWQTRPLVREGAPKRQDSKFEKKSLVKCPRFGLETKTYWLTDRQSQCDFDFDLSSSNSLDKRISTVFKVIYSCFISMETRLPWRGWNLLMICCLVVGGCNIAPSVRLFVPTVLSFSSFLLPSDSILARSNLRWLLSSAPAALSWSPIFPGGYLWMFQLVECAIFLFSPFLLPKNFRVLPVPNVSGSFAVRRSFRLGGGRNFQTVLSCSSYRPTIRFVISSSLGILKLISAVLPILWCSCSLALRQSVSQSVCLGVKPNLGHLTRDFFFLSYCLVIFGAPSLTRGRVCHVSVFVLEVYSSQ